MLRLILTSSITSERIQYCGSPGYKLIKPHTGYISAFEYLGCAINSAFVYIRPTQLIWFSTCALTLGGLLLTRIMAQKSSSHMQSFGSAEELDQCHVDDIIEPAPQLSRRQKAKKDYNLETLAKEIQDQNRSIMLLTASVDNLSAGLAEIAKDIRILKQSMPSVPTFAGRSNVLAAPAVRVMAPHE